MRRTRRQLLGAVCACSLTAGCVLDDGGRETSAARTVRRETTIELVAVALSERERTHVSPLVADDLPTDERRILAAAADGGFTVRDGRNEYPTDGGRTAGLQSLIDRALDRLEHQRTAWDETASPSPSVDAVYVRYDGDLYCLSLVDGDQRYYTCEGS